MNSTKAMILAGGMSTRLYPLTKQVPKPLVPVAGEPITAHIMRWLASFGFTEVGINVHYLSHAIDSAFGDGSRYGVKLNYVRESELMGSAGAVKPLEAFFDRTFVVVGCDDLTDANLDALVAFHKERGALATIGLVEAEEVDQYGVVLTDDRGRITEFQEKPPKGTERSKLVNTGIYVFEPEIFSYIPAETFYDFGKGVFPALLAAGAGFYGLRLNAYWRDIGTPKEYRLATSDVLAGRVRLRGARATGVPAGVHLGNDVRIEGDVRLGSNVSVGRRVRIVGPTVIGDGVRIGDEAVIERSIVWDAATLGARVLVRDSIVGIDYDVPADTSLIDRIVANEPIAT
ncbi:MAG TPA: NDP-sugar synthase [Candidatus Lustribacter sp.]|nr:NDP-sugar synthase [Candidatus Lustribacter sp.]